jgi:hypothetical protein
MVEAQLRCCLSCCWLVIVGWLCSVLSLTVRLGSTSARSVFDVREEQVLVLWREPAEMSVNDG